MGFLKSNILVILSFFFAFSCLELEDKNFKYKIKNVGKKTKIKVMTFNILSVADLATHAKGYKRWFIRKPKVFETIKNGNSDFIAIQESSPNQAKQLNVFFQTSINR